MRRAAGGMVREVEDLSRKRSRETMWPEGDNVFNHPEEGLKIEMGGAFSFKPTLKEKVAMVLSGQEEDGHQVSNLQMSSGFLWPSPGLSSDGTLPVDELSEEVDGPAEDEPMEKKMKKQQMSTASVEQMKPKLKEKVLSMGKDDSLLVRTTPVLVRL